MKKLLATVMLFFFLTGTAFAGGPVKIKKGEPAPYDGWVFTQQQEEKVRLDIIELQSVRKQIELKTDLILNYKQQIEFHVLTEERYKRAWEETEDSLLKVTKAVNRNKLLYMLLGIGLTVGAGYAMGAAN